MRHLLVAVLAALAVAAPAQAAQVSVSGGVLRVEGELIDADATQDGDSFSVLDYTGSLDPGDGCSLDTPDVPVVGPVTDRTITCTGVTTGVEATVAGAGNFLYVVSALPTRFTGGPGQDTLISLGSGATEADGGAGADYLNGGDGADTLRGGAGEDGLRGGGAADSLAGGDDRDHLQGDDGGGCCIEEPGFEMPPPAGTADVLDGGGGSDSFEAIEPADRVSGGEGRDTALFASKDPFTLTLGEGGLDVESVSTQGGDATVRGDARANDVSTGEGRDTVDPGAGFDKVTTGPGDDTVAIRDGFPDYVDCGEGADRVVADTEDEVDSTCETVERVATPAAPPANPAQALIAPSDLKVTARRKGRRVTVRGRLLLPAGAAPSLCTGGGVTLEIRGVARRTLRRGTVLSAKCTFTVRLRGKGRRRVRVKAYFAGTPAVAPINR